MTQRFSYVKYDKSAVYKQEKLKEMFTQIENFIDDNFVKTRESALLLTALEEAYMWAGKAIRDEQITRSNGEFRHEPTRG